MKFLVTILIVVILSSCAEDREEQVAVQDTDWSQDQSVSMNSFFSEEERNEIENFLSHRPDWKMTETGTGLHYMIYSKSENNDTARIDDIVTVNFEISLLDGTICYTSSEKGPESFMVEKSDIESGLHEGIKFMCTGDRAKFILPSHMAHGLIGDSDQIPPLSTVIYDIELIKIEKSNEQPNS